MPSPSIESIILTRLFAAQDIKYRDFHSKLIPTVDPDAIIGVRTPQLRKLARELGTHPEIDTFLHQLPHRYFDENSLHALLIADMKDYPQIIAALDEFLPHIDNWATCDILSPKRFKKHLPELEPHIRRWMADSHPYTIRFGIGMLLQFYLDAAFRPEFLDWVCQVHSDEYYVNMMIAWYFATALAKQYPAALPYLEENRLPPWVHQKTIQKAIESYRIPAAHKTHLKTLKHKKSG